MTTIADVAKRANVSKMTVSRVINHPDQVTEELKTSVFQAMADLGYVPNVAAKALVNNKTQVIKMFILEEIDTTEPYYMNLLMGVAKAVGNQQYSLQLVTKGDFDTANCDGVIITGYRQGDIDLIKTIHKPVVLFGENQQGIDFVDSDNQYGTKMTTNYGIKQGYQQLIYLGIDMDEAFELSREAGYLAAMQAAGLPTKILRFDNHSTLVENYLTEHWADFQPNTCFICSSDRLAIGAERGILKCGGNIPLDFGIIGFDGVFLDQVSSPKLTTAKQSIMQMGEACGEMLMEKIEAGNLSQGYRRFLPELVIRDSTK